ncbi:MAG: S9 family peptidase [Bacteroides sp.]|nr:S9 family peptidase [Bacteroides sp.]
MNKFCLLIFFYLCTVTGPAQTGKPLELAEIIDGKFRPENIRSAVPLPDGEHYTQMNSEGNQIIKYSFRTGKEVEVIFDVNTARECTFNKFDGYEFSPDGEKILIRTNTTPIYRHSYSAVYYVYAIKRNLVESLSDGGPQQAPVFSPDGESVAFVRDNNIFLVKILYGNSESQVTEDGRAGAVLNGIPDWVYEEEFSMGRAMEFSPDNQMLAFMRFEEADVPEFSFQLFAGADPHITPLEDYPGLYSYKYPKAGYPNSKVSVHTFDIKTRVTRKMDLPLDADGYIPRIRFTRDPNQLAIMTLNRHQNRFDMYFANPRSTVCKLILRDENEYYINYHIYDNIKFYLQNFSFLSDRSGYHHLYWYTTSGNLVKQVTSGNFEVTRFLGWDQASGTFYYESNQESPLRQAIYKTDSKGKQTKISQRVGTNQALFSTNFNYYINTYSALHTPPVITLNDNTGKELATLVDNQQVISLMQEYTLPSRELFTFTTSKGTELNGWMIKPAGFNASAKYPVILYQYSGPGSQEVVDRWNIGGDKSGIGWDSYMANQGFIIVCVDGRGTGGRGTEFMKSTYLNLGIKEAEDQVETARYIASLPYADGARIGIWGWSFGGYTTIMSMSEGTPVFKAGAAVAAVTDWKYYDTIYGERYMRTPRENAEGYRLTSVFTRASNLNGRLLLVHGTADDNVHLQNCLEYAECLVQLNKQFDMQLYTNRNHSILGGNTRLHLFTRLTDFFRTNL